jgi:hypothetical protein
MKKSIQTEGREKTSKNEDSEAETRSLAGSALDNKHIEFQFRHLSCRLAHPLTAETTARRRLHNFPIGNGLLPKSFFYLFSFLLQPQIDTKRATAKAIFPQQKQKHEKSPQNS